VTKPDTEPCPGLWYFLTHRDMFLTQKKTGWKSGVYLRDDAWMSQGKGRARRCTRPWSVPVFVHVDFSLRLQLYAHSRTQ